MYIIWLKLIWLKISSDVLDLKLAAKYVITQPCVIQVGYTGLHYRPAYIHHQALCQLLSYKYIEKYDNEIFTMPYWLFGNFYHCLIVWDECWSLIQYYRAGVWIWYTNRYNWFIAHCGPLNELPIANRPFYYRYLLVIKPAPAKSIPINLGIYKLSLWKCVFFFPILFFYWNNVNPENTFFRNTVKFISLLQV